METFAKATWAFQSEDEGMLSFPEGAVIKLINFNQDDTQWRGEYNGKSGSFPSKVVTKLPLETQSTSKAESSATDDIADEEDFYPHKVVNYGRDARDRFETFTSGHGLKNALVMQDEGNRTFEMEWRWKHPNGRKQPASTWVTEAMIIEHGAQHLIDQFLAGNSHASRQKSAPKVIPAIQMGSILKRSAETLMSPKSDISDEEELQVENEGLTDSTLQLIATVKEIKIAEQEARAENLNLTNKLEEVLDEVEKRDAENELLRRSAQELEAKLLELAEAHKTELEASKSHVSTLAQNFSDLEKENAALKLEVERLRAAAAQNSPSASLVPAPETERSISTPASALPTRSPSKWDSVAKAVGASAPSSPTSGSVPIRALSRSYSMAAGQTGGVASKRDRWGSLVSGAIASSKPTAALSISDEVKKVYDEVREDQAETNWAFFAYDASGKTLVIRAVGKDGASGLVAQLKPEDIGYGLLRVPVPESRPKYVFINWCGASVKPLKRARMSTDRGVVLEIVPDAVIEVHGTTLDDVNEVIQASTVNFA